MKTFIVLVLGFALSASYYTGCSPVEYVSSKTTETTAVETTAMSTQYNMSPDEINKALSLLEDDDVLAIYRAAYMPSSFDSEDVPLINVMLAYANGLVCYTTFPDYTDYYEGTEDVDDFGEDAMKNHTELGYLSEEDLSELKKCVLSIDKNSSFHEFIEKSDQIPAGIINPQYRFYHVIWDNTHTFDVFINEKSYNYSQEYYTYDENSIRAREILSDFEAKWKTICEDALWPDWWPEETTE